MANSKWPFPSQAWLLNQLEMHAPEVIDSFRQLAKTNCVEFLSETYSHALCSVKDPVEFKSQIELHSKRIESLFGKKPKVFRNTELIYSDEVGEMVAALGYKTILTEGCQACSRMEESQFCLPKCRQPQHQAFAQEQQAERRHHVPFFRSSLERISTHGRQIHQLDRCHS